MPISPEVQAILIPSVCSVASALGGLWLGRKQASANTAKTNAEAESISNETMRDTLEVLRREFNEMRNEMAQVVAKNMNLQKRVDDCENDRAELHRQIDELRREVARLGQGATS